MLDSTLPAHSGVCHLPARSTLSVFCFLEDVPSLGCLGEEDSFFSSFFFYDIAGFSPSFFFFISFLVHRYSCVFPLYLDDDFNRNWFPSSSFFFFFFFFLLLNHPGQGHFSSSREDTCTLLTYGFNKKASGFWLEKSGTMWTCVLIWFSLTTRK